VAVALELVITFEQGPTPQTVRSAHEARSTKHEARRTKNEARRTKNEEQKTTNNEQRTTNEARRTKHFRSLEEMKVINKTIEELKTLEPDEALDVFNFVLSLKGKHRKMVQAEMPPEAYMAVRDALKNCSGSLGDEIINQRSDRI
jgi:hypothetical protein